MTTNTEFEHDLMRGGIDDMQKVVYANGAGKASLMLKIHELSEEIERTYSRLVSQEDAIKYRRN